MGFDRFVVGRLADGKGNSTVKKRKSAHEIFMDAIMETNEEEAGGV